MAYEVKWREGELGKVALWKREANGNGPVISGTVTMKDGATMDIALWKVKSENGRAPVLSGSVSVPYQKKEPSQPTAATAQVPAGYDDEIPF